MRIRNFGLLLGSAVLLFGNFVLVAAQQAGNETLQKATALHSRGNVQEAIPLYQSVVKSSHNTADVLDARYGIAGCMFTLKEYDQAKDAFLGIAQDYPKDPKGTLSLVQAGNCLADMGKLQEAADLFDKALATKASPSDKPVWWGWANLGKGRVLVAQKQYSAAMPYLKQALLHSSETEVSADAGPLVLQCLDTLKKAGKPVDESLRARVDFEAGNNAFTKHDPVNAVDYLTRAVHETTDPAIRVPAYITLGEVYMSIGLFEDALNALNKVPAIHGDSLEFKATHARWMLDDATDRADVWGMEGRPDEVIRACDEVLPKYSDGPADSVARVRMEKAVAFQEQGKLAEAAQLLETVAASKAPDNLKGEAAFTLGSVYQNQGHDRQALGQYLHYLSLPSASPGMTGVVAFLSGRCYRRLGDVTNQQKYFKLAASSKDAVWASHASQVLQLLSANQMADEPSRAQADLSAGRNALAKHNPVEAVQYLTRAAHETTDPTVRVPACLYLGKAYTSLLLVDDALKALETIPTIHGDSPEFKASEAKWLLDAAADRANLYNNGHRPDEAILVCDEALAKYSAGPPDSVARVRMVKAEALEQQGKLAQAETLLRTIESSKASEKLMGEAAFSLGMILQSQGQDSEAVGQYRQYLNTPGSSDGGRAMVAFMTGRCYRRLGDAANARKYFKLAASTKDSFYASQAAKVLQLMPAGS